LRERKKDKDKNSLYGTLKIQDAKLEVKGNITTVQIRHNGRVTGRLFAGRPLGEKMGHPPRKREPLGDRVILMNFREWR